MRSDEINENDSLRQASSSPLFFKADLNEQTLVSEDDMINEPMLIDMYQESMETMNKPPVEVFHLSQDVLDRLQNLNKKIHDT